MEKEFVKQLTVMALDATAMEMLKPLVEAMSTLKSLPPNIKTLLVEAIFVRVAATMVTVGEIDLTALLPRLRQTIEIFRDAAAQHGIIPKADAEKMAQDLSKIMEEK